MKRQKADNGKEAGMIHSWRCSEGKSYITVHAVFISSANKYMFLWILKDPFERLLAGPGKPSRLKAPSAFSPLSQALWHFQWVGALTTFLFPEWFPPASNSKRGTPVLSTSAYHAASRAPPGATSSPHRPRHPPFSLIVSITAHSLIPPFPSQFLSSWSLLASLIAGQNQAISCKPHIKLSCLKWKTPSSWNMLPLSVGDKMPS